MDVKSTIECSGAGRVQSVTCQIPTDSCHTAWLRHCECSLLCEAAVSSVASKTKINVITIILSIFMSTIHSLLTGETTLHNKVNHSLYLVFLLSL